MTDQRKLRVVFLIGPDRNRALSAIEAVCALPNIEAAAALVDTENVSLKRRFRNLRNNIRKEGWRYLPSRVLAGLRRVTDQMVQSAVVSDEDVHQALRTAFPERCFSLSELGLKYGFEVIEVGSLNSSEAVRALKTVQSDLGIVLGTRILKENIFSLPRMGCINLHKGKVPEYRGMPPGFWELYDGASTAGVTIHFVDKGLDTGDIVSTSEVFIKATDTPDTLMQKLDEQGSRTLATAVTGIQAGTAKRLPQGSSDMKPRSKPTQSQIQELQKRLPHWHSRSNGAVLLRNIYSLVAYYSGMYFLTRLWHRKLRSRACVLLYHRVNDFSRDALTVDTRSFAAQLLAMRRYPTIDTAELVDRIRGRKNITPTSIIIHFDDCYQDILLNGAPILKTAGYAAVAFVSSGFVDTERVFTHDAQYYPFRYPNLRIEDIRAWVKDGFEIGAHTINHADLGKCNVEEAQSEIVDSRSQLERALDGNGRSGESNHKVAFFSFPYGRTENIRPEIVSIVRQAGYSALFSAHGGFVGSDTDLYDIPRVGCSGASRPLQLLLEIEGLAPAQMMAKLRKMLSWCSSSNLASKRASACVQSNG